LTQLGGEGGHVAEFGRPQLGVALDPAAYLGIVEVDRRAGQHTSRGSSASTHWLCEVLNDAARSCATGTYIDLAAEKVEQGLIRAYKTPW
jgi:hypothetical protein